MTKDSNKEKEIVYIEHPFESPVFIRYPKSGNTQLLPPFVPTPMNEEEEIAGRKIFLGKSTGCYTSTEVDLLVRIEKAPRIGDLTFKCKKVASEFYKGKEIPVIEVESMALPIDPPKVIYKEDPTIRIPDAKMPYSQAQ